MNIFNKKGTLSPEQEKLNALKEELRRCEKLITQSMTMFDMATDENLIEARIYEIKSLNKHRDYLLSGIKQLVQANQEQNKGINV